MNFSKEELEQHLFVDVRSESEFEKKKIKDSMNMPYRKIQGMGLKNSIGYWESKLSKDKIIVIYCATGRRAKDAERILRKKGYEVINLLTFEHAEDYAKAIEKKAHGK